MPADHKWFSRLATAAVLVTALHPINPAELVAELGLTRPADGGDGDGRPTW